MGTTMAFDADEEQSQQVPDTMADAGDDYRAMVDNANDEAFVAEGEKSTVLFDVVDTLTVPDLADEEKMEVAQSAEFNEAIEADQNIIQMCNEERAS